MSEAAIKPIETVYKGYRFRSRLEARWAVFFDACGVEWEYEPEGYELQDGTMYLPDFRLYGVETIYAYDECAENIFVEVKGRLSEEDENKILKFAAAGNKILTVIGLPECESVRGAIGWCGDYWSKHKAAYSYSTIYENEDSIAVPIASRFGGLLLSDGFMGSDDSNDSATKRAYDLARQARFEHGETPHVGRDY